MRPDFLDRKEGSCYSYYYLKKGRNDRYEKDKKNKNCTPYLTVWGTFAFY